jgi:hypothetical protein
VFQGGAFPEWTESWLFKRLAAAGKLDCGRPAGLSDILGDRSEDFVDLEDEVRYDGAVPASDGLGWNSSITSGGCVQRMPNDLRPLSPESLYLKSFRRSPTNVLARFSLSASPINRSLRDRMV